MAVELGTGYVSIVPSARGFGAAMNRELSGPVDAASRDAGERGGRSFVGRFTSGFGGIGTALAGAFAATQAVQFLGDSISAASDLEETMSKVNTIFGESAGGIDAWSQNAATALGQSRQQALDAAGTFGNLFVQLGIGSGVSADMSTSLVELASDFASFHNANPAEVIEAQTAAFRGEYDALQRFVPTINAAAVAERAMADTGKDNADALTDQEKAAATYALMVEGAGDAMGDFDRTSDGLANRQRILSAQFEDVKAKIGSALLPAVTAVAGFFINTFVPAVESVIAKFREWWPAIQAALAPIGEFFATVFGTVIGWFQSSGEASDTMGSKVSGLVGVFTSAFETIQSIISTFVAIATDLWGRFGDDIVQFARDAWDAVVQVIEGALQILTGIFDFVKAVLTGKWGEAWDAILSILNGAWDMINGVIDAGFAAVRGIVEVGLGAVSAVFSFAWNAIKTFVSDALDAIVGFVSGMPGRIASAAAGMWNGIVDGFRAAINAVIRFWNNLSFTIGGGSYDPLGDFGPSVTVPAFTFNTPNIPTFDDGGIVPGRKGAPTLAIVHGGETVLPTHKPQSSEQSRLFEMMTSLLAAIEENTRSGGPGWSGLEGRTRLALTRAGV